jgi:type IV secretion system protein TrbI
MSDAKEDPSRLELRATPRPVTRLNRKTIVIASFVIGATVLGVTLWSLQPKTPTSSDATSQPPPQRVARAEGLESLPRDYAQVPATPRLGPPLGELGRPVVRAEQEAGLAPMEGTSDYSFQPDHFEDARRADRLQQVQEDEEAAKAQVFFQLNRRDSGRAAEASPTSSQSALDRALSLIPGAVAAQQGGVPPDASASSPGQNGQPAKQSFARGRGDADIYGSRELQTPKSPYQVMAGTVVPAALITGINSDLPGQIIASVTENIYDTVTGRFVLIPQGSRLLGQYDSEVAYGQSRVLLVWTRLLLPDGSSLTLDRLPGVDAAGYSGLEDKVNWHWGRIFAGAAVSTLIGVGAELASPARQNDGNTVVIAGRESIQSSVTDVGQQITQRNLNIQPTLTVRPGFPVRVIVNKDLVLRPFATQANARRKP